MFGCDHRQGRLHFEQGARGGVIQNTLANTTLYSADKSIAKPCRFFLVPLTGESPVPFGLRYLSRGCRQPLGRPALPLGLGGLNFLSCLPVDADDVVVSEDLAVDHGLLCQRLPLLELSAHVGLLVRPLLLSRLL